MSAKRSKRKLVRLANGMVEYDDATGETMLQLREMSTNMGYAFCDLARAVKSNDFTSLPDYIAAWCRGKGLAQPMVEFKLYDDVRDVIESATEWRNGKPSLRSSPLHQDQTGLKG